MTPIHAASYTFEENSNFKIGTHNSGKGKIAWGNGVFYSLDFSMATSNNAKRFKHYNTGCWTVSKSPMTGNVVESPKYLAGFADYEAAAEYFANLVS